MSNKKELFPALFCVMEFITILSRFSGQNKFFLIGRLQDKITGLSKEF